MKKCQHGRSQKGEERSAGQRRQGAQWNYVPKKTDLERVIGREVDVQEVDTPRVRAIRRPHDSRLRDASVTVVDRVLDGI